MVGRTVAALVLALASVTPALADRAILGQRLQLRDPKPGIDPAERRAALSAREPHSPDLLVGNPTVSGAEWSLLVVNADTANTQYLTLPAANWTAKGSGYIYKDAKATAGPIRLAQIGRSRSGTFRIKATLVGGTWGLSFPPLPAMRACVTFAIGDGDRYHVDFPPAPGSTVTRSSTTATLLRNPVVEGYCYPPPPTTTTSTSVTTTTNPNAFCGDGYRDPGEQCDGGPACTPACVQEIPSCCSGTNQCVSAPLFSLNFYLMQYCSVALPGSFGFGGGICAADGSCASAPITPVPVCCQLAGACNSVVATSTAGLWTFQNVCRGAQSGTYAIDTVCGPTGLCVPE